MKVVSMTFEEPGLEERHREGTKTKFLASYMTGTGLSVSPMMLL